MKMKNQVTRKVWAFLLAFVMVVSLIVPNGFGGVFAESISLYTINMLFKTHDGSSLITGSAGFDLSGQKMYAVVSFANKTSGVIEGYGVKEIDNSEINNLNAQNDINSISLSIADFYKVESESDSVRATAFTYDDSSYSADVRLYRTADSFSIQDRKYNELTNVNNGDVTDVFSTSGTFPATGYAIKDKVLTNSSQADIIFNESNADYYFAINTTLSEAPSEGLFPNDGSYLIFVKVYHPSGNTGDTPTLSDYTYYLQNFVPTGTSYYISKDDITWKDFNGNTLPYEKYTPTNAQNTTVTLLRVTQQDKIGNITVAQAAREEFCKPIAEGEIIKGYKVSYGSISEVPDTIVDPLKDITYTQGITLTKTATTDQYTLSDVLGDAINFGVLGKSITHKGHSETNMATYSYSNPNSFACDPDLSGNGETPIAGDYYISSIVDENIKIDQIGNKEGAIGATLYLTEGDKTKFTGNIPPNEVKTLSKDVIDAKVKGMIDTIKASSATLYNKTQNVYPQKVGEAIQIDATGLNGTAYVDVDANTEIGQDILTALALQGKVQIFKDKDQLIVFNFKNVSTVNKIAKIDVINGNKTYDTVSVPGKYDDIVNIEADIASRQVIWNLAGVKSVGGLDSAGGVFLMPEADSVIEANGASCGWVASAGDVNLGDGGEFHFVYRNLQSSTPQVVTGSLSISKSQYNGSICAIPSDKTFTFEIKFTAGDGVDLSKISAPTSATYDSTTGVYTVTLRKGDTAKFSKIPSGVSYTVEEIVSAPYELQNVVCSEGSGATVDSSNSKKYSGTINVLENATKDVSFEYINKMNGPDVDISKKSVSGSEVVGASIEITRTDVNDFKFTAANVTFGEGATETNQADLEATGGSSKISFKSGTKDTVLHNLPDGTYKMHEVVAPDGYLVATDITFTVENGAVVASGTSVKAAVTDEQGNVTNNAKVTMLDGVAGHITITKTLVGAGLSDLGDITFKITYPDKSEETVTLNSTKANTTDWKLVGTSYVYTKKNVPTGEYTITEESAGAKGNYSLKSTVVSPSNNKVTVEASSTSNITFTNTYDESASLKISKSFSADSDIVPSGDADNRNYEFTLTLKNSDGTAYANKVIGLPVGPSNTSTTDAQGKVSFKLKKAQSVTITDIPVGVKYTVSETVDNNAIKYGFGFASETPENSIVSGTNTVVMENTYSEKKTKIVVEKEWKNDDINGRPASISVQLKKNSSNEGAAVTLNEENNWTKEWSGLPVYSCDSSGKWTENQYSVDETAVPDGYVKTVSSSDITNGKKITITNTKSDEKVGSLQITKTVNDGDSTKQAPDAASKSFEIEVAFKDGTTAYSSKDINLTIGSTAKSVKTNADGKISFELKAGETALLGNIKDGVSYTVKETAISTEDQDHGYTYDSTAVGNGYSGSVDASSITPSSVTIDNTYSEKKVAVSVNKVWDDENNQANARPSKISVQLKKNNVVSDTAELTATGNWTKTWDNLPEYTYSSGTWTQNVYTVSETQVSRYKEPDIQQPSYVTSASGVKQYTGNIVNKKDVDKGYIKLTKTIEGPVTDNDFDNLTFTVKEKGSSEAGKTYKFGDFTTVTSSTGIKRELVIEVADVTKQYDVIEHLTDVDGTNVEVKYTVGTGSETTAAVSNKDATISGVTPSLSRDNATSVSIRNIYTSQPVSTTITANKTLSGETLAAGKFSFKLTETTSGASYTETVTNAANGTVTFSDITYTKAGVYTYTVEEVGKTDTDKYEYSDKVYTVTVTVTNTKGALSVSKAYSDGSTSVNALDFVNTKKGTAPDTGYIDITKTIKGDVTVEDLLGLSFTVTKVGETTGKTYTLKDDFTRNGKSFTLTNKIVANVGDKYIVQENLVKLNGFTESVSYEITAGDGNKTDGKGTTTGELSVVKDKTTTVAYENDYAKTQNVYKVHISKIDAVNKKEIAGAKLELYAIDARGNKIVGGYDKEWISEESVKTFDDITAGDYAIKELVAPTGYELVETLFKFRVSFDASGKASVTSLGTDLPGNYDSTKDLITFENDPIKVTGKLSVHVVEEKTNRDVPDATVLVEAPDGTQKTYKTNSKGEIVDENGKTPIDVAPGKYKITVTQVPEGYEVTVGETAEITVPENGEARHEAKILPKSGGLKVKVVEEGTNREVPNATVEIEAPSGTTFPDGSTKIIVTTDEHGNVTGYKDKSGKFIDLTTGLTPGDYKITVTKVPEGYKVTTGKTEVVTVKPGEVAEHLALIGTAEKKDEQTTEKTTETTTQQTTETTTQKPSDTPSTEVKQPNTTTTPNAPSTPQKDTTVVNTGDSTNVVPIIIVMIISLIGIIFLVSRKRKMRYEY